MSALPRNRTSTRDTSMSALCGHPSSGMVRQLNVGRTKLGGMIRKFICSMVGYLMLAASAHGETVGVVMMHGKHGTPTQLQQLAAAVANAGFLVERPEMCWSAA